MEIFFTPKASRLLKKLSQKDRDAIQQIVNILAAWPNYSADIIRLSGREDYRIKKGRYRAIFDVLEADGEIHVTYVGLRDESTYK